MVGDVYDRPPVRQRVGPRESWSLGVLGPLEVIINYRLLNLAYGRTAFFVCELYLYLTGTISLKFNSWSLAIYDYCLSAGEFLKFQDGLTAWLNCICHLSYGHLVSGPNSLACVPSS